MNKLFRIFLLLSVVFLWRAEMFAQSKDAGPKATQPKAAQATEAIWDLLLNVDLTVGGGSLGNAGVVYVPSLNKFWVSKWSSQNWYTINADGTRADSFVVAGVGAATSSARAMTTDGQFVYMAANSASIFKVDPATRTLVSTIPVTGAAGAVRFLSYDATLNSGAGGFWVGNFSTPIRKLSMAGATLSDSLLYGSLGSASNYGGAIDRSSANGPFLYLWGQGAGAGTPQVIVQVNPTTGLPTGVMKDVITDVGVGQTAAIAGGITVTASFNPQKVVLAGVLQGTPDKLFVYELSNLGPLPGPGLATNPTPANNATGVNINASPDISWTNPATGTVYNKVYFSTNQADVNSQAASAMVFNGKPSTASTSYNQAANLNYNTKYYWRVIEFGSTDSTPGTVWNFTTLPAPAPKPATNVAAAWNAADTSINLSWVNPTQNINNQPITVDSCIIIRDSIRIAKVTGATTVTYKDRRPPVGLHIYSVVAWAGGFASVPAPSNVVAAGLYINTYKRVLNTIIPDNDPNGFSDAVVISGPANAQVAKVVVRLDSIVHTWDADLDITLTSPNGTTFDLTSDNGSSGDNYVNCVFDDEATASITTAVAPMTGLWKPEQPLAPLAGTTVNGTWTLKVVDDAAQDTGRIFGWTLVLLTNAQIPVELTSFNAATTGKDVEVTWTTATEVNNKGFEVQRKAVGSNWKQIGFVEGKGTSTQVSKYIFNDMNVASGKYEYRLRQVDFDGSATYSSVVNVDMTSPVEFALNQNYPNPFNPATTIEFSLATDAAVTLKLYNALGQEVKVLLSANMKQGVQKYSFNAQNLTSGIYFYKLEAKGVNGQNFSQLRKMILMK